MWFRIVLGRYACLCIMIFVLAGLRPVASVAETLVFTPHGDQVQSLNGKIEYLEDVNGAFSINDIVTKQNPNFKPLTSFKSLGYAYKGEAIWIRFTVDLSNYSDPYWFLTYDSEHIGNLTFY